MEEITKYTKLDDIELPEDWSDEDYAAAVQEIDESSREIDNFDFKFMNEMVNRPPKQLSERQRKRIYKIYRTLGV